MESIEKPIVMLELNRWEYNCFFSEWRKKGLKTNLVQLESRGHHSQNNLVSSSARVVEVLEKGRQNQWWSHLGGWNQEVLCPNFPSGMWGRVKKAAWSRKGQQTWGHTKKHVLHRASILQGPELLHAVSSCCVFLPESVARCLPAEHPSQAAPAEGCCLHIAAPAFSFCFFKHPVWPTWNYQFLRLHVSCWFAVSVLCWPALPPKSDYLQPSWRVSWDSSLQGVMVLN